MSKDGEVPFRIMLLPHEHSEIASLAKEVGMHPERWTSEVVRIAIAERRDSVAPIRLREREIAKLKGEIVRLTQTLKTGACQ